MFYFCSWKHYERTTNFPLIFTTHRLSIQRNDISCSTTAALCCDVCAWICVCMGSRYSDSDNRVRCEAKKKNENNITFTQTHSKYKTEAKKERSTSQRSIENRLLHRTARPIVVSLRFIRSKSLFLCHLVVITKRSADTRTKYTNRVQTDNSQQLMIEQSSRLTQIERELLDIFERSKKKNRTVLFV